jgi:hypothetical protein
VRMSPARRAVVLLVALLAETMVPLWSVAWVVNAVIAPSSLAFVPLVTRSGKRDALSVKKVCPARRVCMRVAWVVFTGVTPVGMCVKAKNGEGGARSCVDAAMRRSDLGVNCVCAAARRSESA